MSENINTGAILEALNDKTDRDCRNVDTTAGADAVIAYQVPTSANNYTWYRLYKSGWVEQGGISNANVGTSGTINLPITMADTKYQWQASVSNTSANNFFVLDMTVNITTSIIPWVKSDTRVAGCWEVKGFAAQS